MPIVRTTDTWRCAPRLEGQIPSIPSTVYRIISQQLLDRCLKIVDPELFAHLRSKNLSAEIYAFPCAILPQCNRSTTNDFLLAVLTLCACTPPLNQVLQLWDFLLAFGVHLNVLCVIAQLLLMRDEVMKSPRYLSITCHSWTIHWLCISPMRLLRTFPDLEALPVIGIAVTLVRDLPPELYDELVKHPFEIQNPWTSLRLRSGSVVRAVHSCHYLFKYLLFPLPCSACKRSHDLIDLGFDAIQNQTDLIQKTRMHKVLEHLPSTLTVPSAPNANVHSWNFPSNWACLL